MTVSKKCPTCGNTIDHSARRCPGCNRYLWSPGRLIVGSAVLLFAWSFMSSLAHCQDKPEPASHPRVFIRAGGAETTNSTGAGVGGPHAVLGGSHATVSKHDDTADISEKLLQKCPAILLTTNDADVDYVVTFTREMPGMGVVVHRFRVANAKGDVLAAHWTRMEANAAKEICKAIQSDWRHAPAKCFSRNIFRAERRPSGAVSI